MNDIKSMTSVTLAKKKHCTHPVPHSHLILRHGTPRSKPGAPAMGFVSLDIFEQVRLLGKEHAPCHHHVHDAPERPPVDLEAVAWQRDPGTIHAPSSSSALPT